MSFFLFGSGRARDAGPRRARWDWVPFLSARVDNCAESGCVRLSPTSSIVRFYAPSTREEGETRAPSASYRRFSCLAGVYLPGSLSLFARHTRAYKRRLRSYSQRNKISRTCYACLPVATARELLHVITQLYFRSPIKNCIIRLVYLFVFFVIFLHSGNATILRQIQRERESVTAGRRARDTFISPLSFPL